MQETQVRSLGWEWQPHSSILAWKIPWTKEPGGPQSIGLQRVGHSWTAHSTLTQSCLVASEARAPRHWVVRLLFVERQLVGPSVFLTALFWPLLSPSAAEGSLMNSGSFSRKSSTVSNLGGFFAAASCAEMSHTLHETCGSSTAWLLGGFPFLRSVSGQQLVASVRMYLTLFQRRGGVPTL